MANTKLKEHQTIHDSEDLFLHEYSLYFIKLNCNAIAMSAVQVITNKKQL